MVEHIKRGIDWAVWCAIIMASLALLSVSWQASNKDATKDARLDDHDRRIASLEKRSDAQDTNSGAMKETLGRIDERVLILMRHFDIDAGRK
jgi:hypothetical protein